MFSKLSSLSKSNKTSSGILTSLSDLQKIPNISLLNLCSILTLKPKSSSGKRISLISSFISKKLDSLNNLSNPVKDYSYYYMKASMLFANKNYEKAKEQISNGLALNVDNDKLNILLAWIFEEQNELESAINIYDEMYSKTGRVETMLFREFTKSKMSDRILPEKNCSQFKTGKFKSIKNYI